MHASCVMRLGSVCARSRLPQTGETRFVLSLMSRRQAVESFLGSQPNAARQFGHDEITFAKEAARKRLVSTIDSNKYESIIQCRDNNCVLNGAVGGGGLRTRGIGPGAP